MRQLRSGCLLRAQLHFVRRGAHQPRLYTAPSDPCTHLACSRRVLGNFFLLAQRARSPKHHGTNAAAARNATALLTIRFMVHHVLRRVASEKPDPRACVFCGTRAALRKPWPKYYSEARVFLYSLRIDPPANLLAHRRPQAPLQVDPKNKAKKRPP